MGLSHIAAEDRSDLEPDVLLSQGGRKPSLSIAEKDVHSIHVNISCVKMPEPAFH
jgi:hypothetical protein